MIKIFKKKELFVFEILRFRNWNLFEICFLSFGFFINIKLMKH